MTLKPAMWIAQGAAVALAAMLSGCGKSDGQSNAYASFAPAVMGAKAPRAGEPPAASDKSAAQVVRHIAIRQSLVIEAPAESLEAMSRSATERCQPPVCELLESTFAKGNERRQPQANLRLRIKPDALTGFIAQASQGGEIIEQRTEAEDKTDRVVDTEARITNLIELRERLRKLLKAESAKVKDLIEVERELSRVQTELDSAQGMRKLLADETERVTVSIELRAKREFSDSGAFASLKDSLLRSGHTLAESVAALVTFAVAILPWAIAFAIVFALIRRWWRRRKIAAQNQKNN